MIADEQIDAVPVVTSEGQPGAPSAVHGVNGQEFWPVKVEAISKGLP